ncbi:MAG: DUF488 domain-containing protein [Leptospirales bacterium]
MIQIQRIYDSVPPSPGTRRILVDRLWPRGLSREKAALDFWAKDWAPSDALRVFFHLHPEQFSLFREQYKTELDAKKELILGQIHPFLDHPVHLLFASRNLLENNAIVLKEELLDWLEHTGKKTPSP